MAISSDEDNAKLALRQLNRQVDGEVPASDLGELKAYVTEAYSRLTARSSEAFDPKTYAKELAEKAARAYAKAEYTGQGVFEERYERAAQRWANQAATEYHRDDLQARPYRPPADRYRSDIHPSTGDVGRRPDEL